MQYQDSLIGGVRTGRSNAKLFVPGFIDIGARVSKVPTGRALRFGFFIFPSARWPPVSLWPKPKFGSQNGGRL
jgi:hypothetical protein